MFDNKKGNNFFVLNSPAKVIITNLNYEPRQGDIVVVSRNIENSAEGESESQEPIIKRVIAVGGQTVDIDFDTHEETNEQKSRGVEEFER